ncbi:unnamed protein product [Protopolystoma xenopodis]|uniref:CortBP2/NAV1-like AAA+ ATPase lid domain-containing protein n=1 Tax=Protopolystoma xenopodis TaxID=117903 RepID=A0A448WEZ2_9PLAT|nr:unnamed protein product [Protopolystoma xenopodis]
MASEVIEVTLETRASRMEVIKALEKCRTSHATAPVALVIKNLQLLEDAEQILCPALTEDQTKVGRYHYVSKTKSEQRRTVKRNCDPKRGHSNLVVMPTTDYLLLCRVYLLASHTTVFGRYTNKSDKQMNKSRNSVEMIVLENSALELPNCRRILFSHDYEPVKGFLLRHLRRSLVDMAVSEAIKQSEGAWLILNGEGNDLKLRDQVALDAKLWNWHITLMENLVNWLPQVWRRVNLFLSDQAASSVTKPGWSVELTPSLLADCPLRPGESSEAWFVQTWNQRVVPHVHACLLRLGCTNFTETVTKLMRIL